MSLQRRDRGGESGLEPRVETPKDWRDELESPRWGAAPLRNPEMNPTRTWVAILFWGFLAALTFVLVLVGYGTGFWT
jgi:hypothetical protein